MEKEALNPGKNIEYWQGGHDKLQLEIEYVCMCSICVISLAFS